MAIHDPKWWTGPIDKIQTRLSKAHNSADLAVLVTTGAFCPIHAGHIQMMETAKRELETRETFVLGGYFAPDHDQYVSSKLRHGAVSAAHRLDLCERAVASSDWLMVDRWAAMYSPRAVGFTMILHRISRMLAYQVRPQRRIRVVYVFGGDNAMFAYSFLHRGSCICVVRPGSVETVKDVCSAFALDDHPSIIFSWDITPPLHSTGIRQGDLSGLPDLVGAQWKRILDADLGRLHSIDDRVNFYMRDEGVWPVEEWAKDQGWNLDRAKKTYTLFCMGLHKAFAQAFAQKPRMLPLVEIIFLPLQNQPLCHQKVSGDVPLLSLNPCIPSTANLQISRCFKRLSMEDCGYVATPGAPPLGIQVESIELGSWILFDTETEDKSKMKFAASMLSSRCAIISYDSVFESAEPEHQYGPPRKRLDTINCRDFLAGSRSGGIVLQLSESAACSAPGVLPYVRPHHHASVPVIAEMEFSREVWRLNKEFFSSLETNLKLNDMSPGFQTLCGASLDFPKDMSMVDVCGWHLETFDVSLGHTHVNRTSFSLEF